MEKQAIIPEIIVASKIFLLRNERVILDVHLAELYEVETRTLKQAVKRNKFRFPSDFMFELTNLEIEYVVSQNVIPSKRHFGGAIPLAFTENGVAMLSSVLTSKKAIDVNIAIMRIFTILRKNIMLNNDLMHEIEKINKHLMEHDDSIFVIFDYIKQVEQKKTNTIEQANRRKIGFKQDENTE